MLSFKAGVRIALATMLTLSATVPTLGHGVVGNRFFPATISTDDPFVADELALPTVSHQKVSTDRSVKQTDINGEFAKRITPDIAFSIGSGWTHLDQAGPPRNPICLVRSFCLRACFYFDRGQCEWERPQGIAGLFSVQERVRDGGVDHRSRLTSLVRRPGADPVSSSEHHSGRLRAAFFLGVSRSRSAHPSALLAKPGGSAPA